MSPGMNSSLASTRERRANAGANMSKLLDKEETLNDDFYKTQYGGFDEVANDSDFSCTDSSDSENVIDSDFDIDENQDVNDDDDPEAKIKLEEKEEKSRKRTMVYKDPKGVKPKTKASSTAKPKTTTRPVGRKPKSSVGLGSSSYDIEPVSKNLRKSTLKSTREANDLHDERKRKKRRIRKQKYHQWTQEELLREAKKTEVENIKSLEAYKNLEIEKTKKNKINKASHNIPMIRYYSYTELVKNNETKTNDTATEQKVENEISKNDENTTPNKNDTKGEQKFARTIITFPDRESFEKYFKETNSATNLLATSTDTAAERKLCPITGLPAKYVDPLTGVSYANAKAFSLIRYTYNRYLETSHLKDDARVKKYLESNKTVFNVSVKNAVSGGSVPVLNTTGATSITTTSTATNQNKVGNNLVDYNVSRIATAPTMVTPIIVTSSSVGPNVTKISTSTTTTSSSSSGTVLN